MKLQHLIVLNLILILISCNSNKSSDTIVIHDTIVIYKSINDSINSLKIEPNAFTTKEFTNKIVKQSKENFYNLVKNNFVDSMIFTKLDSELLPEGLVMCMLFEDKKFNESIIFFFLKYYHSILKKESGNSTNINNEVNHNNNRTYMSLLYYQYSKITKSIGPMNSEDVYFWVLDNQEYLENKDILDEFNNIEKNPKHIKKVEAFKKGKFRGSVYKELLEKHGK